MWLELTKGEAGHPTAYKTRGSYQPHHPGGPKGWGTQRGWSRTRPALPLPTCCCWCGAMCHRFSYPGFAAQQKHKESAPGLDQNGDLHEEKAREELVSEPWQQRKSEVSAVCVCVEGGRGAPSIRAELPAGEGRGVRARIAWIAWNRRGACDASLLPPLKARVLPRSEVGAAAVRCHACDSMHHWPYVTAIFSCFIFMARSAFFS